MFVATGQGVEFNKEVRFSKYREEALEDEKTYFAKTIVEGKEEFLVFKTSVQIRFMPLEKR